MTEKIYACNKMNFVSNINEVIRAAVNSLFIFFLQKDFARTKSNKKYKNATKQKCKTQISKQK